MRVRHWVVGQQRTLTHAGRRGGGCDPSITEASRLTSRDPDGGSYKFSEARNMSKYANFDME